MVKKVVSVNHISNLQNIARKLAKGNKYQTLYSLHKEIGCNIFKNSYDYTNFQLNFLHFLSFYSNLFLDIYMGEVPEIVLNDELFEDCYMEYKSKLKKEKQQPKKETNQSKFPNNKGQEIKNTQIMFKRKKKL